MSRTAKSIILSLCALSAAHGGVIAAEEDSTAKAAVLLSKVTDETSPDECGKIARQIAAMGPGSAPKLIETFGVGNPWNVQKVAADALVQMGPLIVEPCLRALRDDPPPCSRAQMLAEVIEKVRGAAAVKGLAAIAEGTEVKGPDFAIRHKRRLAVAALGKIGGEDEVPILEKLVNDGSVCHDVVRALGSVGGKRAEAIVAKMLDDEEDKLSRMDTAIEALRDMKAAQAAPRVARCLSSTRDEVVVAALRFLGEMGYAPAISNIATHIESKKIDVARAAAQAVAEDSLLKNARQAADWAQVERQLYGKLSKVLSSAKDQDLRRDVARAIFMLGFADDTVTVAVRDEKDTAVQSSLIQLLGKKGDRQFVPLLLGIVGEEKSTPGVRRLAAGALADIGSENALAPLIGLLDSNPTEVSWAVAKAIERISGKSFEVPEDATPVSRIGEHISADDKHKKEFSEWLTKLAEAKKRIRSWWDKRGET